MDREATHLSEYGFLSGATKAGSRLARGPANLNSEGARHLVATAGNQSRCTLIFFEMFSSPEEHKFHLEQDHMKRMLSALEGKLAEAPIMTKLNAL